MKKMKTDNTTNHRLIKKLRDALNFSEDDCTDERILSLTKGSLLRAGAEVALALEDLTNTIRDEGQKILNKVKEGK